MCLSSNRHMPVLLALTCTALCCVGYCFPTEYEQRLLELQFDYQQKVNAVEALKLGMRQLTQSKPSMNRILQAPAAITAAI